MTASFSERIQLRNYQLELIQQVFRHWGCGEHGVMVQLPTGGGKTIIFCAISASSRIASLMSLYRSRNQYLSSPTVEN